MLYSYVGVGEYSSSMLITAAVAPLSVCNRIAVALSTASGILLVSLGMLVVARSLPVFPLD